MPNYTFPVSRPIELVVRAARGTVTVAAQDGCTEATVSVEPADLGDPRGTGTEAQRSADQTTVELRGTVLVVHAPRQGGIFDLPIFGRRSEDALDIRVTVPAGTNAKISSFTAPITTSGRLGRGDIAFGAADAHLEELDGDLRLRFGSGTALVGHVHGDVQLRSGAGDATFGEVDGDLNSGGGSGTLRVGIARRRVHARTGAGGTQIDAVHGDVHVTSGSGALRIGLPAGVDARLDLATGSGTVRSDLPIGDEPPGGGSAITVHARTGSGDVVLFRAA